MAQKSDLEATLLSQILHSDLPPPERQVRFHPTRRWQVDFLWRSPKTLAVEVEGAIWVYGRHNHPTGFAKDVEKYNQLTLCGIPLLRFHSNMIHDGTALQTIRKYFDLC